MQFSFDLDNNNEKTIDEIASGFWGDVVNFLNKTENWPTSSLGLIASEHSGIEKIAKDWVKGGKKRTLACMFDKFQESQILADLVRAERNECFLLVLAPIKTGHLGVSSADLKSRLANLTNFEGLQPSKRVLVEIFAEWCRCFGVKVKKTAISSVFSDNIFDFVTLFKLVSYIKSKFTPGSKLSLDDLVGIKTELERETRLL